MTSTVNSGPADGACTRSDRDQAPLDAPREIASETLLGNQRAIRIRHGPDIYTLSRTSNGKLILTK